MTSSIRIPQRNPPLPTSQPSSQTSPSSASSSLSLSPHTPPPSSPSPSSSSASSSPSKTEWHPPTSSTHTQRLSLLSSSLSAQEHTVINVGDPDGPPRLITCVKTSQGFDWNQEIFLPARAGYRGGNECADLERRKDPVHEIVLTDEEREGMVPG